MKKGFWKNLVAAATSVALLAQSEAPKNLRSLEDRLNAREISRLERISEIIPKGPNLEQEVYRSKVVYEKSKLELGVERESYFGPVFFHWFRATGNQSLDGQWQYVWTPSDGRASWDGSIENYERHSLLAMKAGFNFIFSQVAYGFEQEEVNHFVALKNLRDIEHRKVVQKIAEKYLPRSEFLIEDPSKLNNLLISPYFAAESFPCYDCDKDFNNERVLNRTYNTVKNWFDRFLSVMDVKDLAVVNGKVLAGMWYVPGAFQVSSDFFEQLNERIKADFGFECFWSTHYAWQNAKPDQIDGLFSGMEPINYNAQGNVDLLPGFWPPTEKQSHFSLKRNGGLTFASAFDDLRSKAKIPKIISVESMREITEASDISVSEGEHSESDPHSTSLNYSSCFLNPCHPVRLTDKWTHTIGPDGAYTYLILPRKFSDENKNSLFPK